MLHKLGNLRLKRGASVSSRLAQQTSSYKASAGGRKNDNRRHPLDETCTNDSEGRAYSGIRCEYLSPPTRTPSPSAVRIVRLLLML
jgi:hypothetical protein